MSRSGPAGPRSREEAELLRADRTLGVPIPAYSGRSLANIGPTVFRATGAEPTGDSPLAPPLDHALDPFRGRRAPGTTLVVMVDGFGWEQFDRWGQGTPLADGWRRHAHPLTTVFPSTTSAALTSLSTGAPPGRHGLVGYRQFLPKYGLVADMLKMSPLGVPVYDQLVGPNWTPEDIVGCPSLFRRYGIGAAVSRDRFQGTGFTRILYDGAEYVGYATASELAHELARLLGRPSPPPVVFLYWDELDTIQHLKGVDDRLFGLEVERLAHLLGYVADSLPARRRTEITTLITGDHGQVSAGPETTLRVDSIPALTQEMARPLAGDRRAGFFCARPGRLGALREALSRVLPPGSRVLEVEKAIGSGLFGPPPFHPELEGRTGELLALVPSPWGLTYLPPGAPAPVRHLRSGHGGLESAELLVPLVAGSFAELTESLGRPPQR
ncbi:MAG: alkaline phosphatase family protein [Thermoplasmata archaeon]|nr:alkaline phosphatase family protein [Thermoplasmata archaeon]